MAPKTHTRPAKESISFSESANKKTRALRYGSLTSVLTNLDSQATVLPGKFKLDRISSADSTELAELRANVATLKAESERLVENLTDEISQLAQSRLGGASGRPSHVRNAPLATVGPKKAACCDGPKAAVT
jgi:hypothetical protein